MFDVIGIQNALTFLRWTIRCNDPPQVGWPCLIRFHTRYVEMEIHFFAMKLIHFCSNTKELMQ